MFKNCAPFKNCRTETNAIFVDEANFINITMPIYNLMEYSNNYSDTSGSLWQFKRDEIENNANNLTFANCSSFESYQNLLTIQIILEMMLLLMLLKQLLK